MKTSNGHGTFSNKRNIGLPCRMCASCTNPRPSNNAINYQSCHEHDDSWRRHSRLTARGRLVVYTVQSTLWLPCHNQQNHQQLRLKTVTQPQSDEHRLCDWQRAFSFCYVNIGALTKYQVQYVVETTHNQFHVIVYYTSNGCVWSLNTFALHCSISQTTNQL